MEISTVWPSTKHYSKVYSGSRFSNEESMPLVDDRWTKSRDFEQDRDDFFLPSKIDRIQAAHRLPYTGKKLMQDPAKQTVIHPIEVVIDLSVIEAMHLQSLEACKNGAGEVKPANPKETGGFLGGRLMCDSNGRYWTHIIKSVHTPHAIGEADQLEIPIEIAAEWSKELKSLGLENVGFWHSHPTYEPFQSDARLSFGADVEATFDSCKAWWKSALVIDPFCGARTKGTDGQTQVGVYKITKPGLFSTQQPLVFNEENEIIGWRSVGFAIKA